MSLLERFMAYKRNSATGRLSISLTPEIEAKMHHDDEVIEKFLAQRDLPKWHRGTSHFQQEGARALFNAIRDDTEQRTAHRTRACMSLIGLKPLISGFETKKLMRLSRGNDLAFLWFLLEVHYKTSGPNYSVNEQLIMSCIVVLDLITTLRELDRILPPGHPPLKEIKRQERLKEKQKQNTNKDKQKKRSSPSQYVLPYFEKLSRPKPYGKPLTIPMPDFSVQFGNAKIYKNANYQVPNESNRWYSKYDLQPGKRIANRIINDELQTIFQNFAAVTLKTDTVKTLCEHHKIIHELESSLEHQLRVIARDRCLKMIDVEHRDKETREKRIRDQLDRDVEAYLCKFHKIAKESRQKCAVHLLSNDCCGCGIELLENSTTESGGGETCAPHRPPGLKECDSINVERDLRRDSGGNIFKLSLKEKCYRRRSCSDVQSSGDGTDELNSGCQDCALRYANSCGDYKTLMPNAKSDVSKKGHLSVIVPFENPNRVLCKCGTKLYLPYDYGHSEIKDTPTPSQTFFAAPSSNKPYQFDYRKIFHFKENTAENLNIRQSFVEALDSDVGRLTQLQDADPDVDAAVQKCVNKIWREQVANKNRQLDEEEEERKRNEPPPTKTTPLNYDEKWYNPDNRELMSQMLKDALAYMARDPKYVLASLPESHKVPILREWIMHRYGKVYSRGARFRAYNVSLQIFRALEKITLQVPMPNTRHLGKNLFVDYSCRDYLLRKSNFIKKEYYKRLDAAIMDQARIFWFAMRPYLCTNGPPRNTYFAYMPSRISDISRFRLWKPTEYMNAKGEWERRMCEKANIRRKTAF